jgi:hypothetical protein
LLNGNGSLDTATHRLLERVIAELAQAEPPTEELRADGGESPAERPG